MSDSQLTDKDEAVSGLGFLLVFIGILAAIGYACHLLRASAMGLWVSLSTMF
ncbi:MAG: hypothetical protein WC477_06430 [Patescibacteria group bacterium]